MTAPLTYANPYWSPNNETMPRDALRAVDHADRRPSAASGSSPPVSRATSVLALACLWPAVTDLDLQFEQLL